MHGGSPLETGERMLKNHIYPGLFPAMFPGFALAGTSGLCRPFPRKPLIYQ